MKSYVYWHTIATKPSAHEYGWKLAVIVDDEGNFRTTTLYYFHENWYNNNMVLNSNKATGQIVVWAHLPTYEPVSEFL
jgi:hypothetical protein